MSLKVESLMDELSWKLYRLVGEVQISGEKKSALDKVLQEVSNENLVGMAFGGTYLARFIDPMDKALDGIVTLMAACVRELDKRGLSPYPTEDQLNSLKNLLEEV